MARNKLFGFSLSTLIFQILLYAFTYMLIVTSHESSEKLFSEIPVTFRVPLESITITENEPAVFECELSKPTKNIQWLKDDNTALKHGKKYDIKSTDVKHSLRIPRCIAEDAGKYTIVAGGVKSTAELKVIGENRT